MAINFILDLAIVCLFLGFCSIQIGRLNRLRLDEYRFRYFALRDRLALMVVRGEIKESSWEYENIVEVINFHIRTVETFSIDHIVSALVDYHLSTEERRRIKIIKKKMDNPEIIHITAEIMAVTSAILCRNSRAQIWYLTKLSRASRLWKSVTPKPSRLASQMKQAVDRLSEFREELLSGLSAMPPEVPATQRRALKC